MPTTRDSIEDVWGTDSADVIKGNTGYQLEGTRADGYNPYHPDPTQAVQYDIYSDSEGVTPSEKETWGKLKQKFKGGASRSKGTRGAK